MGLVAIFLLWAQAKDGWADLGARFDIVEGGALVVESKGELHDGDIVIRLNGETIDSAETMVERVLALDPAKAVKLRCRRGAEIVELEFTPKKIAGQKEPGRNNWMHHPPALRAAPLAKKEGALAYVCPLVVSLAWEANAQEIAALQRMLQKAAGFFFDSTEGQIAFGTIDLFNSKGRWEQAHFRIRKRPGMIIGVEHVTPGGICEVNIGGPLDSWGASMVFAHEACHQILGCGDEYKYVKTDPESCHCMMGDDCQAGRWDLCTRASHKFKMKESCWQNVKRWYPNVEEMRDPKPGPALQAPPVVRVHPVDVREAILEGIRNELRESRERVLRDLNRMLNAKLN
jgi:hypothetical protein